MSCYCFVLSLHLFKSTAPHPSPSVCSYKIERYINSPEVRENPPDYRDILQLVQRVNQRHNLSLSRSQLSQIAQDAFQETGSRLQERRHLDMVFNFGSHLTDAYKPSTNTSQY